MSDKDRIKLLYSPILSSQNNTSFEIPDKGEIVPL